VTDDTNHPEDPFDAELADAISEHQTDETIQRNARCVAIYYQTLIEFDVPSDHATELTCHWASLLQADG